MRKFIRHPTDIPIEYKLDDVVAHKKEYLSDVSHGGLSFLSRIFLEPGSVIHLCIPIHKPVFTAEGVIVWCRRNEKYEDSCYDVGVEFKEKKTEYGIRMVEQVCYIEHYKKEVSEKEGRKLTGKEAAVEWINKYAKDFPK